MIHFGKILIIITFTDDANFTLKEFTEPFRRTLQIEWLVKDVNTCTRQENIF